MARRSLDSSPGGRGRDNDPGTNRWRRRRVPAGAAFVDEALDGFSGCIAADELYEGPFCVLFIVDNRKGPRKFL
jgi:hypothetical protein